MKQKIVKLKSKATTPNPKDIVGATKVDISLFPVVGILHGAHAMMDGAKKYDPYNWRAKKVQARIYYSAAQRHIMDWMEGEECASDSGVHHLGHAIACLAILLDCQHNDCLIDNRPIKRGKNGKPLRPSWLSEVMEKMRETIKEKTK